MYWAVIGPTLTLTTPRYSSPSTSCSWAPGSIGAIRSTSVRTFHASGTGTSDPELVGQLHVCRSSLVSMSAGSPWHGTSCDEIRPLALMSDPGPLVAARREEIPHRGAETDRVAALAIVGGHAMGASTAGHRPPRLGRDQGLVAQARRRGRPSPPAGRASRPPPAASGLARPPTRVRRARRPRRADAPPGRRPRSRPTRASRPASTAWRDGPPDERAAPPRGQQLVGGVGSGARTGSRRRRPARTAATRPTPRRRTSWQRLPAAGQIAGGSGPVAVREATGRPCRCARR